MMKTLFFDLLDAADKGAELRKCIRDHGDSIRVYALDIALFAGLPNAQFSYSLPTKLLALATDRKVLANKGFQARQGFGASTRFHRLRWEVPPQFIGFQKTWADMAHGTKPTVAYKATVHVVRWHSAGAEAKADVCTKYPYLNGNYGFKIQGEASYGLPGLAYGKRTNRFTCQVMPAGHVFSFEGTAIHAHLFNEADVFAAMALLNSKVVAYWLNKTCAQHKAYNYVNDVPWPHSVPVRLSSLGKHAWSLQYHTDTRSEYSPAFRLPALLQAAGPDLVSRAQSWGQFTAKVQNDLDSVTGEIDELAYCLYGLTAEERRRVEHGLASGSEIEISPDDDEEEESDEEAAEEAASPMVAALISWSLGVAFGRFDVRLATGARPLPPEPDPFDPLPVCSPGMLTGDNGLPVAAPPSGYPLNFPTDGVLVDDPGHPRDLLKAVRCVFDEVFDDAHARWHEAAELVGARGGDLRDWFARTYFGEHIKRYSKSRRKAPIYWQLATASGSYSVWVYIHRATPDTLFRVLNDFVGPKLDHEREKLDRQTRDAGPNPSRTDRDSLAAQEAFVDELQALRAEVARVAPLWKPDLDDGVLLNFAPLWRLVPQERSWQTECRKAWDKLCAGEYDWAHLAMHLWPERVVPKCTEDRSLAIAHGLEDVFWREDGSGNWHAVDVTEVTLRQLVEERTSSSVKAALKDLLAAPAPTGKSGGRRAPSAPARVPAPRRAAPVVSTPARTSTAEVDEPTLTAVRAAIAAVAEGASKADVQATTGLSDADWNCAIVVLLERGDVTRTGQKRGTRYHPKGEPHA